MTFNSARVTGKLAVDIVPADPLASNSYGLGGPGTNLDLSDANQVFSIKASAMTADGTVNFQTGVFTANGTSTHAGGTGKDPDGEDVDLDEIYSIYLKNTGDHPISISDALSFTPGTPPVSDLLLPSGGVFLWADPAGLAITAGGISLDAAAETVAWELIVVGKTGA